MDQPAGRHQRAPRESGALTFLALERICKTYGDAPVLRDVSLEAPAGAIVALLGPSGGGKTTLLRIVAGLEPADSGTVRVAGEPVDGVPPHRRGFGLMFQDYALFPHLDVAGNVAFGLRDLGRAERERRVADLLDLVGLRGYGARRVYELSGGERQRVALARALAPRPRLLMLDEPLAALDRTLRERLQDDLWHILRAVGVTTLYVTHDQEEAFALADAVALLNAGRVEQFGAPEVIYRQPASVWAAQFLGLSNILRGTLGADGRVETPLGPLACRAAAGLRAGQTVAVVIYPDAARASGDGKGDWITGTVGETQFRGRFYRVELHCAAGPRLTFELQAPPGVPGAPVALRLAPEGVYALPAR
ncbi:MAG: ABC transporter ATP-binding protein [Oscillochloridaceae bacterium]|nr:ABC transporter ATP-binding protein [Chloroflexaceae bacterium]MDW8389601.1 ABC transporter ATP-binding protein [Oscillochloridaceae bacterium]